MDKDRCKSNLNTTRNAKCSKPDTCVHLQSIRQKQQQICTQNSTQVLHVVDNFQPNRSEDKFFDCLSVGDSDCKKCASKKISSCKSGRSAKGPNKSDSNRLDDPEALRAALERIAHGTQMMLKNFEQSKNGCRKPCNATLEITARLITDANDSGPNCHFQGRPVTMKMPLEFDPSTGQLGTKSVSSSRNVVCKQSCNNNQPPLESNTGMVSSRFRKTRYRLSSLNAIDSEMFAGSCTPTGPVSSHDTQSKHMEAVVVPLPVPGLPPQLWEEKQAQSQSVYDNDSDFTTEVEWVQEPLPPLHDGEETRQIGEIGEISLKSDMDGLSGPLSRVHDSKRYYMALPQHRDFSNCSPCRFYPSPIMDEEGNVFCPGNCGCCQCAWKKRSFDDNRKHTNIKVCSCVQRGTIFTSYNQRENCSQISDFDFCPCREKAEAKFLELYNCEMWSSPTVTRGPEVRLDQIMELMTPTQPHSPCLALMYMRDERPSPQSAPAADASAAAVVDNTNISRKMQTDKSYLQDKWRPNRIDFELESNNVSKNTSPTEIQSKPDVVSIPSKPSQTDTSFLYDKYIISRGERNTQDSQSQTDVKHDLQAMGNIRYPTNYAPVRSDDNLNANENQSSASSQIVSHRSSEPTVPATALMCPSKSMPTVCGSTTFQSASSQLSARCQPCGCRSQDTQWYSLDSDSSHICPSATKQPSTLSPKKCCNRSPVTKALPSCCQPKMQSIQNQSIRTDFSLRKCSCNSSTSRGKYKSALPTRSGYAALDIDIESNTQYSKRSCNCQATRTSYQRSQSLPCSSVLNKTNRNVNVVYCPKRDYVFGSNQIDVEKALHLDVCNCASDRSASAFAQSKDTCFLTLENNSKAVNATTWNSAKSEKSHGCSKSEDEPAVKNAKSEKSCGSSSTANAIAWNSVQSEKSCGCPKSEVATTWKSAKSEKSFESSRTADATAWNSVQSEKSCGCPKSEVATTWKSAKSEKSFESSRTADATAWNSVQSEKSCGCPKSEVATTWKSAKSEKSFESSRTADATAWNSAKSERSCTCSKTMDASVCNNSAKFDGTCTGTCQSSTIGKASDICSTTMKSIPGTTNATVWNSTRSDKSCGKTGNVNEISCTCSPSDQNIIGKPFNKGASKMSSIPGISNVTARESKKSEKSCGTSERPNASDICSTTMKSIPGTTNASVWNSARSEVCTCGESDKNTILETIVDTESIPSTVNATAWNSLKSDKSCGITETSGAIRWTSIKSEKSCACGPSYQSMISKPSELAVEHLPSAVNVPASNNEKSYRSCGISWQINATASCACNSQNKSNKCTSIPGTINAMSIKSSKSDKSNTKFFPTDSNPESGCDSDNLAKSSKSQRSCRAVKSNAINNASENTVSSKSCVAGPSDLEYCSAVTKTNPPTIAWASLHSISQGPVSKSSKTEPTTSCSRSVMAQITCLCSPEQRAMLGERGREADDSPPFVRVKESCLECGVSVVNPCLISATDTTHNGTEDYEISKSCYTTTPSQVTKLVFMQADGFCDCSSSSNTSISKFADNEDYETSNKSPRNVDGDPAKNSNSRSFACPKAMNSGLKSQSKSKHLSMKSAISCSCDKEVTDYTSTRSEQTHCSCNIKTSTYDLSIQDFDMEPESVGVVMNCNTTVCVDKATFDKLSSMNQSNQSSRSQNNARERLFEMVDLVTNTRDPGVNRGDVAKQIIRELTMILRKEEEESKPPKLSFEDCMEAVQRAEKLAKNQLQTEADVNRMQCLGQMEQYLQSCFPQKKLKAVQETEIVAFEIDPNFIPYHASPSTSEPEAETRDVVQFASCYTEVDTRYVGSCYTDDNESKQISPKGGSLGTRSMKDAESRLTGSIKTNEPKQITSNRGSVGRTSMKDTESRVSGSIKTDIASDKFLSPLASTGIPSESWLSTIPNASSEISEAQASIEPIAALEDTTIVSSANMASPNSDANTSKRDSKVESLSKGGNESMSSVHPSSGRDESSRSKEKSLGHSKPQLPEPQIYINSEVQCNNELCPASVVQGPNRTEEACDMCELDVNDPLSPLTDRERLLCEYLLRRMCELCDEDKELNGDLEEDVSADRPSLNQPCLCCHCRALVCDNQCKTISKTMDSAMYDPVAEMKFFIDSVVFDLQAMEHVMNKNKISPKSPKPSSCMGSAPGESFPVTITDISSLGCRALYVRWELQDCSGVGGYEIYVDGHLTNRFFSHRHEAGVISNVDVSKRHQIILRAQAIGQEFPGEERAICNAIINAHPEMLVGAQQPWSPSVYFYEP